MPLQNVVTERDLGVLLLETQMVSIQMQQIILKANCILAFIARVKNMKVGYV